MSLDVHYMAVTAERERVPARAQKGWLVAEARSTARRRAGIGRLRHDAGSVLVHLGERLRGAPRLPHHGEGLPALGSLEP